VAVKIELLVDGAGFWPRLAADVATARNQILVQALSFEADDVGLGLARALTASPAADRRVVIDEFTRHVVSDKFIYHPKHLFDRELRREVAATRRMVEDLRAAGVGVRFTNPAGWFYSRMPMRNHKKLVVLDGRVAYLGGINFSDHNFAWHDLMLRIEDERVASLVREDFDWTWRGVDQATARAFGGLELHVLGGRFNECQFDLVLDLLDRAERRIFVESPYLASPFSDAVERASRRGVEVVVVTPERNNWRLCADHILWRAARSSIEIRLFPGRMTHMKAMLVDDRDLVLGSANYELWSYRFQQEYLILSSDPGLVAQFKERIETPDLAVSRRIEPRIAPLAGRLADLRLEWLERVTLAVNGRSWEPSGRRPRS
jgi:cardiolipin synthase